MQGSLKDLQAQLKEDQIKNSGYGTVYTPPTDVTGDNHPAQRTGLGALLGALTLGALSGGALAPVGAALGGMYGAHRNTVENQQILDAQNAFNNAASGSNRAYYQQTMGNNDALQRQYRLNGGALAGAPPPMQVAPGTPLQTQIDTAKQFYDPVLKTQGERYGNIMGANEINSTIGGGPLRLQQSTAYSAPHYVQPTAQSQTTQGQLQSNPPGSPTDQNDALQLRPPQQPELKAQSQTGEPGYTYQDLYNNPQAFITPGERTAAQTESRLQTQLPYQIADTEANIEHLKSEGGMDQYKLQTFMPQQVKLMNAQIEFYKNLATKDENAAPAALQLEEHRRALIQALPDNGYLPPEWGPILQAHPELMDDAAPYMRTKGYYNVKQFKGLDGKTYTYKPASPSPQQAFGKHKAGPAVQTQGQSGDIWGELQ